MPLGFSRGAKQLRILQRTGHTLEYSEAGNRCSGAATEAGGHRDVALDIDGDRSAPGVLCARATSRMPAQPRSGR